MNLSKTRYTKGVQCPKMLWMDQHMPEQFDNSVMNQTVLDTGSMVGDLAMGYYGDFIEVPFCEQGKQQMIDDTKAFYQQALAGKGPCNIAEASFSYDGNFCSVDILRVEPDGVHIVEVKSSTHINDIYYHDMAYQTWVLNQCGLNVKSVSLMHLNSSYVRQGDLDLQQLFISEDCSSEVFAMVDQVGPRTLALKEYASQQHEPCCEIGSCCKKPYPCGYKQWCWKDIPQPSVFDLNRIRFDSALSLRDQGIVALRDVLVSGTKLSLRQRVQAECERDEVDFAIDREAIADFLDELTFPLYFLDFETFQPAVPPFNGTKPYQQIPCQYSLHVLTAPEAALEHYEFLAPEGTDPRRAVAENLVATIPADACTLAYNMSFEKGRIREMAEAFPDLASHLLAINEGMKDLMVPFQNGSFYARAMGGSNSIKAVLPALFPNDPELDYHNLEGVHNGGEAMAAYTDLVNMEPEAAARTREQLLRYCELDTLAMVKIWQRLMEEAQA